ncbi:MAG: hypothetical protein M3Z29_03855 [Pseudomonadota bacterium]|nr:hypothetical protein [Pseudomonadota bacterium]
MRHAPSTLHFSHAFRPVPPGAIEWEELPSLVATLSARLVPGTPGSIGGHPASSAALPGRAVWDATRPATLEPAVSSGPFREPLRGVAVREVEEPEVFRHFFGR